MIFASIFYASLHIIFNMQKYTFFFTYKIFLFIFFNRVIKRHFYYLSDIGYFSTCIDVQAGSFGSKDPHWDI